MIQRGAGDDWGVENVDSPQVRIISMNAIHRPDGVVLVGEVVNEDSVPAYVNVGATLLDAAGTLVSWADAHLAEVDAARAAYDARAAAAARA